MAASGMLLGKKNCRYCGIWARTSHETSHITSYGCMLCPGDGQIPAYQCSSLTTARLHGLLKHQCENTYVKVSTAAAPRRLRDGAPLLPGWQESAGEMPIPTVYVRRLQLDLRAVRDAMPPPNVAPHTTQAADHPVVPADRDIQSTLTTAPAWPTEENSTKDPMLWHPAMDSSPELDLTALEEMDLTEYDVESFLPSTELPLPEFDDFDEVFAQLERM